MGNKALKQRVPSRKRNWVQRRVAKYGSKKSQHLKVQQSSIPGSGDYRTPIPDGEGFSIPYLEETDKNTSICLVKGKRVMKKDDNDGDFLLPSALDADSTTRQNEIKVPNYVITECDLVTEVPLESQTTLNLSKTESEFLYPYVHDVDQYVSARSVCRSVYPPCYTRILADQLRQTYHKPVNDTNNDKSSLELSFGTQQIRTVEISPERRAISDESEICLRRTLHTPGEDQLVDSGAFNANEVYVGDTSLVKSSNNLSDCELRTVTERRAISDLSEICLSQELHTPEEDQLANSGAFGLNEVYVDKATLVISSDNRSDCPLETVPERRAISDESGICLSQELHTPDEDQLVNSRAFDTIFCALETVPDRRAISDSSEICFKRELHTPEDHQLVNLGVFDANEIYTDKAKILINLDNRSNRTIEAVIPRSAIDDPSEICLNLELHAPDENQLLPSDAVHEKYVHDGERRSVMSLYTRNNNAVETTPTGRAIVDVTDICPSSKMHDVDEEELGIADNTSFNVGCTADVQVEGRRIVDITFFFKQLFAQIAVHEKLCKYPVRYLNFEKSVNRGLRTQLFFKCQVCEFEFNIWTDADDRMTMGINDSAVCGTITSGVGCATLQEILAAMAIPPMSHVTYRKYRQHLYGYFYIAAEDEMLRAAALEREIAIKNGKVINGIPYITVVADGSWAKRSYAGGKHDSLSGTAIIFGQKTGLALFIAVRNKYCSVEAKAKQLGIDPPKHICYKNWGRDQSSTAMETDIIVEGFNCSIVLCGLIFKTFIGDGDSSAYQAICDSNPYAEYNVMVKKIYCNNHLERNLCKKITNAAGMKFKAPPAKDTLSVTKFRDFVQKSGLKMRTLIEKARDLRKAEKVPKAEKIKKLQTDIFTIFKHVFCDHSSCKTLPMPCESKMNEVNLIPELHRTGIYDSVHEAVRYLSCHAYSLLKNVTNNIAEAGQSIVSKLNFGKRTNQCAKNSYQMRCYGALVQHNTQEVLSKVHVAMRKKVPASVSQLEKSRKLQVDRDRTIRKENGKRKRRRWQGTDKDYGPSARQPDVSKEVYDVLVQNHFDRLKEHQNNRIQIERDTISQSDCDLWHQLRTIIITASKFGKICKMRQSTSCSSVVGEIRYPKVVDTAAVQFGLEHEMTAKQSLELKLNIKIMPCGLFIDPEIPYLGASPDGLIDNDGIVEIKCPFSAKDVVLDDDSIKQNPNLKNIFDAKNRSLMNKTHSYFYQIQGQLHITLRNYCIFTLWTSVDLKYIKVFRDDEFWRLKMEPLLSRFYKECLLPEIVDGRRSRSMPIREPEYTLRAREEAKQKKEQITNKKRVSLNKVKEPPKKVIRTYADYDPNPISPNTLNVVEDLLQTESQRIHTNINEKTSSTANWATIKIEEEVEITEEDIAVLETARQHTSIDEAIADVLPQTSLLNDSSIDLLQEIIQENCDFHFNPTSYTAYYNFIKPCSFDRDMQIIGGNVSRHWCCVYYDGVDIKVYDSMRPVKYQCLHDEVRRYISRRYPHMNEDNIRLEPVTQQPDPYTCGVYAAAFAVTIALGNDPSCQQYSRDASTMRSHLVAILQNRSLLPFPME